MSMLYGILKEKIYRSTSGRFCPNVLIESYRCALWHHCSGDVMQLNQEAVRLGIIVDDIFEHHALQTYILDAVSFSCAHQQLLERLQQQPRMHLQQVTQMLAHRITFSGIDCAFCVGHVPVKRLANNFLAGKGNVRMINYRGPRHSNKACN